MNPDPAPDARHAERVLALDAAFAALPAPCRRLVYRWREAVCLSGRASAGGSELAALERFVRDVGRLAGELEDRDMASVDLLVAVCDLLKRKHGDRFAEAAATNEIIAALDKVEAAWKRMPPVTPKPGKAAGAVERGSGV